MMVVLGVDAHKKTHTIVACDETGTVLGSVTVKATSAGHLKAVKWASRWETRKWAIEDCRHVSRRLETDLLDAGETVVRVPPKLMAGVRKTSRERGKSDQIDATAIARAALREPDLPPAVLDGPARELKLLVDERDSLVKERTGLQNRLRWRLHELAPEYDPPKGSLDRYCVLDKTEEVLSAHQGVVADLARSNVERIRQITREVNQLKQQIGKRVEKISPSLLEIVGCGPLTAGKLIGEAADITRFKNRDAYASWNGTAPIPASSGNTNRHRINRGGNRQTNAAIHRIAITQKRIYPPAQQLIENQKQRGKKDREALRSLKRRLSDIVYRTQLHDAQTTQQTPQKAAA